MLLPGTRLLLVRHWRLGRWLWERCTSKGTLIVCLVLAALATALSYALPQVPAQVRANSISYAEWLSAAQVRFRDWTPLLSAAGAFQVLETWWFRSLLGLVAFVLLVWVGNDAGALLGRQQRSQPDEPYDSDDVSAMVSLLPPQQVVDSVQQTMNALYRRVTKQVSADAVSLLGRYGSWVPVGPLVLHLGLLSVICALAVNGRWGWQQSALSLLPGEPVLVGPRSTHRIELLGVAATADEARLQTGTGRQFLLRRGEALYWRGYRYRWAGESGPVVEVAASDESGQILTLSEYSVQPLRVESLRLTFSLAGSASQEGADHLFIVSEERMVARLKWLLPGSSESQEPAQFHLWVFQSDGQTPIGDCALTAGSDTTTVSIGGVQFALRFSRSIALSVSYQPGTWPLYTGGALVVLGLACGLMPRRYLRAAIEPGRDAVSVQFRERRAGISWGYRRRRSELMARLRSHLGAA
jgi:ResB-like family